MSNTRIVPFVVASAFFMQNLDGAIINSSLPQMAQAFGTDATQLSVGVTAYVLSLAAFVPLSGWLADRLGARSVFAWAIVVFTLASVACGLSQNLWTFVLARAVQGIGGALMTPVGRMVVLRSAAKSELLRATAMITWPALTAPVIGPALGGLITSSIGWRWNFLLNLPLGLVGVGLVLAFVPNLRSEGRKRLDWPGFILTAASLTALVYGLERFAHATGPAALPLALILGGLAIGALAWRHLSRAEHPLLDLSAFKVPTFAITSLGAGTLFRMGISATPFLLPLLFQVAFGLSAWQAGMLILVYFAGNLAMKPATSPLLRRFGFRPVLVVNGALSGLSIAGMGLLSAATPYALSLPLLFVAGLTRSMQFTALNTLAFADVPDARRGSATTLSSMLTQVAVCLGVAAAAALLNASQAVRGADGLALADFRLAFFVVGLVGAASAVWFLRLERDAGWEVSGGGARPAKAAA